MSVIIDMKYATLFSDIRFFLLPCIFPLLISGCALRINNKYIIWECHAVCLPFVSLGFASFRGHSPFGHLRCCCIFCIHCGPYYMLLHWYNFNIFIVSSTLILLLDTQCWCLLVVRSLGCTGILIRWTKRFLSIDKTAKCNAFACMMDKTVCACSAYYYM